VPFLICYRWQWANGLSFVLRPDYGLQFLADHKWTPLPKNTDAKSAKGARFGIDLEISAGYSF
jgi:hypothetical protein